LYILTAGAQGILSISTLAWIKAHKVSVTGDDEYCQIFSAKRLLGLNLSK